MHRDDAIVGVGFNWDGSDELKMLDCFDMGRHDLFSHFLDLQTQAEIMGYHHCSLARLAELVLGFQPPSAKSVSCLQCHQQSGMRGDSCIACNATANLKAATLCSLAMRCRWTAFAKHTSHTCPAVASSPATAQSS